MVNNTGKVIGFHDGVVFHTLGEGHGFTITQKSPNDKRYYVVGKDTKKNILIVSQEREGKEDKVFARGRFTPKAGGIRKKSYTHSLIIKNTNWISETPKADKNYTAQIRYHGEFLPCRIECRKSNVGQIIFNKPVLVASGQSVVFYDKDICLGGGVVE